MNAPPSKEQQCSICEKPYRNGKQTCTCNAGPLQPLSSNERLQACQNFLTAIDARDVPVSLTAAFYAGWDARQRRIPDETERLKTDLVGAREMMEVAGHMRSALERILSAAVPMGTDAGHSEIEAIARDGLKGSPVETSPPQFTPEQLRFIRNEMDASLSCGAVDPLFQSVYDRAKEILRSPVEPSRCTCPLYDTMVRHKPGCPSEKASDRQQIEEFNSMLKQPRAGKPEKAK